MVSFLLLRQSLPPTFESGSEICRDDISQVPRRDRKKPFCCEEGTNPPTKIACTETLAILGRRRRRSRRESSYLFSCVCLCVPFISGNHFRWKNSRREKSSFFFSGRTKDSPFGEEEERKKGCNNPPHCPIFPFFHCLKGPSFPLQRERSDRKERNSHSFGAKLGGTGSVENLIGIPPSPLFPFA